MRTARLFALLLILLATTALAQEVQISFWDAVGLPQGWGMKPGDLDALPPLHPLYKPRSDFQEIQGSKGTAPALKQLWAPQAADEDPVKQKDQWDKYLIPADEYVKLVDEAATVPTEGEPLPLPGAKSGALPFAIAPPTDRWVEVGVGVTHPPNDAAGRVSSAKYAYDYAQGLTTIYAGTMGGGLWKVVNLSLLAVWVSLGDKLPGSPSIGAFEVDRRDSNHIVVGTGDYDRNGGTGFYWTADEGTTWTRSTGISYSVPAAVFRMHASVDNPDVILAATDQGVFRSADGGRSWTKPIGGMMTDVVQDPRTPLVWYAASQQWGMYRSDDGGLTFGQIAGNGGNGLPTTGLRTSLALCAAAPNYLYAVIEGMGGRYGLDRGFLTGIYRSADYGIDWESIDTVDAISWGQGFHANAIAVDRADPNRVIVGMGGVQITQNATDANVCWTRNVGNGCAGCSPNCIDGGHADFTSFTYAPSGSKIVITNDGGYYVYDTVTNSVNGAANRVGLRISEAIVPGNSFAVARTNPDLMLLGLQDNGDVRIDRTVSASMIRYFGGGDGGRVSISPDDETKWYFSWGAAFTRHLSEDRGTTSPDITCSLSTDHWAPAVVRDTRAGAGAPNIYTPSDTDIWMKPASVNCDWTKLTATPLPIKPSAVDAGTGAPAAIYVTSDRVRDLYVIEQGPPTVVALRTPSPAYGEATATADKSQLFPDTVYYCATGYLYVSDSRGVTWTPVSGNLPSAISSSYFYTYELLRNPTRPRQLFVGTNAGVFRSDDAGANWYRYNSGMPANVIVYGIEISYEGLTAPILRIATKGRGVWERTIGPRRADINLDGVVDPADVVYLINAVMAGGPQPQIPCAADMDGDGKISVADIFYFINYLFAKGAAPPPC